jgi:hypothetical protein
MSNLKTQAILLEQARAKAKRAQKAKNEEIKINVFLHHGDKVTNPKTGEEYTIKEWQKVEKDNLDMIEVSSKAIEEKET